MCWWGIHHRRPAREVEAYGSRPRTAANANARPRWTASPACSPAATRSILHRADVPIWVGDYVLAGYGTGAVMAVPGGDQRDWRFAKHFGLPIIAVTDGADIDKEADERKDATICSEGFLKGLKVPGGHPPGHRRTGEAGCRGGQGELPLRDAAFGRQRYWGEPIPIYYEDDIPRPVDVVDLPVRLPRSTNTSPPKRANRHWPEPRTGPTRVPCWRPPPCLAGPEQLVLPALHGPLEEPGALRQRGGRRTGARDLYVGGSEHATGHLLYFRFWTKFLYDRGWLPFDEPARKLVNQGRSRGSALAFVLPSAGRNSLLTESGSADFIFPGARRAEEVEQMPYETESGN